ncbi:hypothetical protein Ga0609869_001473 [Rhodovulum iodosum]|uniref:Lnb N-terminal periplasmic domain-containing protein n=1 Tax=Rhodovulum iodosum TaxID=68291 RepID=A0ABV3XS12_9RHOB|nr:DUF4105 domain-containing protein [Rhodovulum robiginosum]
MWRAIRVFFVGLAVAIAGVWLLSQPRNDRDWRADYARQPQVARGADAPVLRNIRNWSYAPDGTPTATPWIERALDPGALRQAWFVVEPFGPSPAIAHTMFAFEFEDGAVFVASIEARREVGESYSAVKAALLPIYEYIVVWTTERDMYANSEFVTGDQLFLYRLDIPLAHQRAILGAMIDRTEALQTQPRWYNTLFANCSNLLARVVNGLQAGAVPLHYSWILTGYADSYLHRLGYIGLGEGFATTERRAHISPLIPRAYGQTDPAAFSARLRALMDGRAVPG